MDFTFLLNEAFYMNLFKNYNLYPFDEFLKISRMDHSRIFFQFLDIPLPSPNI